MAVESMTNHDDREDNQRHISLLFGCPGTDNDSDTGRDLLIEALKGFGFKAFTDDFIAALAARHHAEDDRMGQCAEADYRRSLRGG